MPHFGKGFSQVHFKSMMAPGLSHPTDVKMLTWLWSGITSWLTRQLPSYIMSVNNCRIALECKGSYVNEFDQVYSCAWLHHNWTLTHSTAINRQNTSICTINLSNASLSLTVMRWRTVTYMADDWRQMMFAEWEHFDVSYNDHFVVIFIKDGIVQEICDDNRLVSN